MRIGGSESLALAYMLSVGEMGLLSTQLRAGEKAVFFTFFLICTNHLSNKTMSHSVQGLIM